jgi:hypothetical protein
MLMSSAPAVATGDLPPRLVKILHKRFPHQGYQKAMATYTGLFKRSNQAFELAWRRHKERRAAVNKVIEEARALLRRGNHERAARALDGVIDRPPMTSDGKLASTRDLIEPIDAEVPAIIERAQLTKVTRDYASLHRLADALVNRRRVSEDKETERWMWLAFRSPRAFLNIGGADQTPADAKFIKAMVLKTGKATTGGYLLSEGMLHRSGLKRYGIKRVQLHQHRSCDRGDWILASVPSRLIRARGKVFSVKLKSWRPVGVKCRDTNRIEAIDPVTGRVRYKQDCVYRRRPISFTLSATLRKARRKFPSSWVQLVGKVVRRGPSWKLGQVVILGERMLSESCDKCFGRGGFHYGWFPRRWEDVFRGELYSSQT